MMARNNSHVILLSAIALAACTDMSHTYSHYKSISSDGWVRDDTISITMEPVKHGGVYAEELGLRTNSLYPFMQIALTVHQEAQPSGFARTDTPTVSLTDDDGHVLGKGISHYQHLCPLPPVSLNSGDTLYVNVHHDMLRSPLPGVTEVGLTMTRNN